jgi:hypothetical protein
MRLRFAKSFFSLCICLLGCLLFETSVWAQAGNSGTIQGTVTDPSGAVVMNADVSIHNPVSGLDRSTKTDSSGSFTFSNVPYNPYHLTVVAPGFSQHAEDVASRSAAPVSLKIPLSLGQTTSSVTVEAAGNLIETDPTTRSDRPPIVRQIPFLLVGQLATTRSTSLRGRWGIVRLFCETLDKRQGSGRSRRDLPRLTRAHRFSH